MKLFQVVLMSVRVLVASPHALLQSPAKSYTHTNAGPPSLSARWALGFSPPPMLITFGYLRGAGRPVESPRSGP